MTSREKHKVELHTLEVSEIKTMSQAHDRFLKIEATLSLAELEISVSEVHGIVIGALCNHLKSSLTPDLLNIIEPGVDKQDSKYSVLSENLNELYRDNSDLLFDGAEGFDLILPDEDEKLSVRVEGLATWCKGFLLGLLYNNAFSLDQLPESGAEIARDLMEIAEAETGLDQEREEDWALAELEEYVKVGAQLIFEFIYSERASDAPEQTQ